MLEGVTHTVYYGAGYLKLLLTHLVEQEEQTMHSPLIEEAVLLVPGFLGPRRVMRPMMRRFERANVPVVGLNLGLYSALSFSVARHFLLERIRRMRAVLPKLKRLGIVGHSMGGLIAADVIGDKSLDGLSLKLVTLGTPFRGTWAALMGTPFSFAAYELLPIHPRYQATPRLVRELPFLSIAGRYDMLAPHERCHHPDAEHRLADVDHAGLIFNKSVFTAVQSFLETA